MQTSNLRDRSLDAKTRACIETAAEYFTISLGRISVPNDAPLSSILRSFYLTCIGIFGIPDPYRLLATSSSLERILSAILDTDSQAFVLHPQESMQLAECLDTHSKVCLLAQAVAGTCLMLQRLNIATESNEMLSAGTFAREIQLFAESETRLHMLHIIQQSSVFRQCFTRTEISVALMDAIEEKAAGVVELPMSTLGEDLLKDGVAWISDRPCRNMGVPWGFTIMALN